MADCIWFLIGYVAIGLIYTGMMEQIDPVEKGYGYNTGIENVYMLGRTLLWIPEVLMRVGAQIGKTILHHREKAASDRKFIAEIERQARMTDTMPIEEWLSRNS